MNGAPLELLLPGGLRAAYVPQSDPPRYTLNGEPLAVDVVIPDDLARAGWFWLGSRLMQRYEASDVAPAWASIDTEVFPPPGWPGAGRTCFDVARETGRVWAEVRPARKARRKKAPTLGILQATMDL